jgi:two-component system, NarL family, nitrate/nitrite response regulator NarL
LNIDTPLTKIVVFDQNPMLAQGICSLLEKRVNMHAVPMAMPNTGEITNGIEFDIAIIDPGQSDIAPADLSAILNARFGAPGVVGYFGDVSMAAARSCIAAGFRGFLPKTAALDALQTAIDAVRGGALYVDATFADLICEPLIQRPVTRSRDLTVREAYVLKSVARGKSLKEIGLELELSSKTIETYKARGSTKLNLQGRRAIVEYAIRSGWVQ